MKCKFEKSKTYFDACQTYKLNIVSHNTWEFNEDNKWLSTRVIYQILVLFTILILMKIINKKKYIYLKLICIQNILSKIS